MTTIDTSWVSARPFINDIVSLFRRPARLQIAALCYRINDGRLEVMLVTTRSSRRWIIPKGWPALHRKGHRTATNEAYEEAGVVGKVDRKMFASFKSYKGHSNGWKVRTKVLVYLIAVEKQKDSFPEAGQRDVRWLAIEEAIQKADESGLKTVLSRFKTEMAE